MRLSKRIENLEKEIKSSIYFGVLRLREVEKKCNLSGFIKKNFIELILEINKNFASEYEAKIYITKLSEEKFKNNTQFIIIKSYKKETNINE